MIVRLACGALQGVDAFRVDLEVDFLRKGMPAFVMVGLAEGAVREAKERVFAAMRSCGFTLPAARITVNLAPADRRKAGSWGRRASCPRSGWRAGSSPGSFP